MILKSVEKKKNEPSKRGRDDDVANIEKKKKLTSPNTSVDRSRNAGQ